MRWAMAALFCMVAISATFAAVCASARLAAEMQVGGVGLYRRDGFVHLDCGPARRW